MSRNEKPEVVVVTGASAVVGRTVAHSFAPSDASGVIARDARVA